MVVLVERLSETKHDASGTARAKSVRFQGYLANIALDDEASRMARAVSCADKIDNTRSLLASERGPHKLLAELRTRPGQHAHHAASLRALYTADVAPSLLGAFDVATGELSEYIARWLPGHAVAVAAEAHRGAYDKAGAPYVLHPLRLMMRARDDAERMAALLHDVVEDAGWTLERLSDEGFPPAVVRAVDRLTKREGESYEAFIDRVLTDPLATRVKLLDIEDNLDLTRLEVLDAKALERVQKYHTARARLLAALG